MKNNNLSENYEEDIFTDENEELEQENGMFEHFRFEVDKGQALLRIDKYLTAHLEGTSRHRVQQAIDAEYVRVNGNLVKANYKIKPCDLITIHLPYRRRGLEIKPEKMDLDILARICYALDCTAEDIIQYIPGEKKSQDRKKGWTSRIPGV